MKTLEGYMFPFDFHNGLCYLKMRPFTDAEYDSLPHVVLTSDCDWNPGCLDHTLSDISGWHENVNLIMDSEMVTPFDEQGNYIAVEPERHEHYLSELKDLNAQDHICDTDLPFVQPDPLLYDDQEWYKRNETRIQVSANESECTSVDPPGRLSYSVFKSNRTLSDAKYEQIKPCFLYQSKSVIEKTLIVLLNMPRPFCPDPTSRILSRLSTPLSTSPDATRMLPAIPFSPTLLP